MEGMARQAARNGNFCLASLLLSMGTDGNAVENDSPLAATAWNGHVKVVILLLEKGADIKVNLR